MYALRAATSVESDTAEAIEAAGGALLCALVSRNGLAPEQLVSAIFTTTPDLRGGFPAAGARRAGFDALPMLCAQEIDVPGAPGAIVRLLLHVEGARPERPEHLYLGRAAELRPEYAG